MELKSKRLYADNNIIISVVMYRKIVYEKKHVHYNNCLGVNGKQVYNNMFVSRC